MIKRIIISMLFAMAISAVTYASEEPKPPCGWEDTPHPNRGFPIKYTTAPSMVFLEIEPPEHCPLKSFLMPSEELLLPIYVGEITIFPVLFFTNSVMWLMLTLVIVHAAAYINEKRNPSRGYVGI